MMCSADYSMKILIYSSFKLKVKKECMRNKLSPLLHILLISTFIASQSWRIFSHFLRELIKASLRWSCRVTPACEKSMIYTR